MTIEPQSFVYGLVAGLLAPHVYRALMHFFAWVLRERS